MEQLNPCCAEWKKKFSKLEEKRNALRQAVKLLEHQTEKLQGENLQLKRAFEDEQQRVKLEKEAKENESYIREELEKEINSLKIELSSVQRDGFSKSQDGTSNQMLETRVLEGEAEIKRLKQLLDKEKKRTESEKKKAEMEKNKASEAWNQLKTEKRKAEEEKRLGDIERKKAEEYKACLEKSKMEASEAREVLCAERSKADDACRRAAAEKEKSHREKKRADMERAKVEEVRRLAEAEKKKAMDEKARADNLAEQLELERQKNEDLQKGMGERLSFRNGFKDCSCLKDKNCTGNSGEDATVELLKEKHMLEKKRVKHAKRMAKLQQAEKNMLQHQLSFLRQDFFQFSQQLNLLGSCLNQSVKGIDAPAKESSKPTGYYLNGDFWNVIPCDFKPQGENELRQASSTAFESFNNINNTKDCSGPLLPEPGVNVLQPTSGINSDLESPVGDSVRRKSQSSVACSTTASFSDRQFVASQERGPFAASTTTKLTGKNLKCRNVLNISDEVPEIKDKCSSGLAKENDGNCNWKKRNGKSAYYGGAEAVDSCHRKMKRRVGDELESVAWLYAEDRKLQSKIEEKLAALNDPILEKKSLPKTFYSHTLKPLDNDQPIISEIPKETLKKDFNYTRKNESKKQEPAVLLPHKRNQSSVLDSGDILEASFLNKNALAACQAADEGNILLFHGKPIDPDSNDKDHADFSCLEDIINGNLMKLLELDNAADEERYRAAVARPISPTLPMLEPPRVQMSEEGDSCHLIEDMVQRRFENGTINLPFSHTFDVVDLEIGANEVKSRSSDVYLRHRDNEDKKTSRDPCVYDVVTSHSEHSEQLRGNKHNSSIIGGEISRLGFARRGDNAPSDMDPQAQELKSNHFSHPFLENHSKIHNCSTPEKIPEEVLSGDMDCGFSGSTLASKDVLQQTFCNLDNHLAEDVVQAANKSVCTSEEVSDACGVYDDLRPQRTATFCVALSNAKDEDSIMRIFSAMDSLMSRTSIGFQTDGIMRKILADFAFGIELQAEEKASVFLSLLLGHISAQVSQNSESFFNGDMCSGSFQSELKTVISDSEMRRPFLEICQVDCLVKVIVDFLIHREIYVCNIQQGTLDSNDLGAKSSHLGEISMHLSSKNASVDQLVAGSMILASICMVFNHVDFLWETCYKVLLIVKNDLPWALTVLHIFANVCGNTFFSVCERSLSIITIKSIVLLLESGHTVISSSSPHQWVSGEVLKFCACNKCPFSEGAVHTDEVVIFLIKKLECHVMSGITLKQQSKSEFPSSYTSVEDLEENFSHKSVHWLHKGDNESCLVHKYGEVLASQSDSIPDEKLCHFVDVVSLLELAACYMGWCWTYEKVIPSLLEMLKTCAYEEYSCALLVLVGKLGRLGVDAGGYEHSDVAELRNSLSMLLDSSTAADSCLPIQVAVVGAMIDMLPLNLEDIVGGDCDHTMDGTSCGYATSVKSWFSRLSHEQKLLSLNLFRCNDVLNS